MRRHRKRQLLLGQHRRERSHSRLGDSARNGQNTVLLRLGVGGSSFLGGDVSLDDRGDGDVERVHIEYVGVEGCFGW